VGIDPGDQVGRVIFGFSMPDLPALSDAKLEKFIAELSRVPKDSPAYEQAQGYADVIRAELAARKDNP
jgi:hypothetical protein